MTVAGMCRALCENPAKLYGLYPRKGVIAAGSDATSWSYDPKASHILSARDMVTKAGYTPFEGLRTEGGIAKVYLRGSLMVEDGRIVGGPEGRSAWMPRKQHTTDAASATPKRMTHSTDLTAEVLRTRRCAISMEKRSSRRRLDKAMKQAEKQKEEEVSRARAEGAAPSASAPRRRPPRGQRKPLGKKPPVPRRKRLPRRKRRTLLPRKPKKVRSEYGSRTFRLQARDLF